MEDTLTQERKSRSAKHHALNEFNPRHLTFRLPIAVDER
jgi:hypothetical protein